VEVLDELERSDAGVHAKVPELVMFSAHQLSLSECEPLKSNEDSPAIVVTVVLLDEEARIETVPVVVGFHKILISFPTRTKESQDIISWLSALNFSIKQDEFFSRSQAGTREWLLKADAFMNWLHGTERTLWCLDSVNGGFSSAHHPSITFNISHDQPNSILEAIPLTDKCFL
jgi:hypothetical protein